MRLLIASSARLLHQGLLAGLCLASVRAADSPPRLSREEVLASTLAPYTGKSVRQVDTSTLTGKLVCGYQGWFNCEGDGAGRGWVHWVKGNSAPTPANIKVDLWPDVSELAPEERFDTGLHFADGRVAQVFSSYSKATVLRHFKWMQDYGVDGALVQRFVAGARSTDFQRQNNTVLTSCREGANRFGRGYALMYDLSGLGAGQVDQVLEDFRNLRSRFKLGEDPAYFRHHGKPLVAVWGVGFSDHRAYSLADCLRLVRFLKDDPEVGGCAVMLGVPTYWREGERDALPDPELKEIIALADIVSPWTVGRYASTADVSRHAEREMQPDLSWCREHGLDYLPVLFPGFSWHNMYKNGASNAIPRQKGAFFWSQVQSFKAVGASMFYVAMFDEVDEGTAIFKCANDAPADAGPSFVTYEGLPSDYYLRLAGEAARLLRGEIPADSPRPTPPSP